jgi:formylglycine-generating enzyme required for sulfatase activity
LRNHKKIDVSRVILLKGLGFTLILCVLTGSYLEGELGHNLEDFSPYSEEIPGSDVSIEMVPVPGGTFTMGSPANEEGRNEDEGPQHQVKVDSFWMGKYEITWEQYDLFVREEVDDLTATLPAAEGDVELTADAVSLPTPPYVDMSFGMGKDGFPAINMTQYAAVQYAKWLTAKTGRFYRLPTETEWEYACRAGSGTAYHFGNNPDELTDYGWFYDNSEYQYQKIGTKKPNSFNLYDMHGNVSEWTMDQYDEDYYDEFDGTVADNPWLRPVELYPRTVRGGSWKDDPDRLRCAARRGSIPRWKQRDPQLPKSIWWLTNAEFVGFRLVRPEKPPSREEMETYWLEAMEDF